MTINQINGLNRKARVFLLDNCVSVKGAEVMVYGFTGHVNGEGVEDITLIREKSKWKVFGTDEIILSINGNAEFFNMTENTIG